MGKQNYAIDSYWVFCGYESEISVLYFLVKKVVAKEYAK